MRTALVILLAAASAAYAQSEPASAPATRPVADDSTANWFPLVTDPANTAGVIDLTDWLEKPAGRRGAVLMKGDRLEFADGTPVKFWGVNLGDGHCMPSKEEADYWADRFARYGINCVRLHKFFPALLSDTSSWEFKAGELDRLDYFCAKLRERGIYYGWSPIYHLKIRPGDLPHLIAGAEILSNNNGNTYGVMDYAPDIQALRIGTIARLLEHTNPYTGQRYADDPALAFVEMQNEASIFFWSGATLKKLPTYHADFDRRFNEWLASVYTSHDALVAAWESEALNVLDVKDEHLDRRNIRAQLDGYAYNTAHLNDPQNLHLRRRLSDTARFKHLTQNTFYKSFEDAVRKTGYAGPLVGSCWRAQGTATEYYNLRSDYLVGMIDRHNYHGGLTGWKPREDAFNNTAQINKPGGGIFSLGFYQVADRPFAISEWCTVFPNEWAIESPAIMAIYGMGLQDWDASYQFAARTTGRGYSPALHVGNLLWNVERPDQIGIYPVLARMIYRGDVEPGPVISTRRVSLTELEQLQLLIGDERIVGRHDVKTYHGPMPGASFAAGRVVVEFVDSPQPSDLPDMAQFERDSVITSATGQLKWSIADPGKGFFTVDTRASKAVVGFLPTDPQKLGEVTIEVVGGFGGVFVTALGRHDELSGAAQVLVVAMGRLRNTGMHYNIDRTRLDALGRAPILIEPVSGRLEFTGRRIISVELLDHDGRSTGKMLGHQGSVVQFDTAVDKTFYYLLTLE